MVRTRTVPLVESGILSAVAILFAFISIYIPVLGAFVNLVWSVPIILLGVRHGYKWSILATIAAGILIAIFLHPLHGISIIVGFGLIGIVLGYAIRMGFSPLKTLIWGSAASLISKAALLVISALVLGINPLTEQGKLLTQSIEQVVSFYRNLGMSEADLAQISDNMNMLVTTMKVIFPTFFVLASIFDTFLNYIIAKAVLKKLGHALPPFPPLKTWRLPRYVIYIFALAIVMVYWGHSREITLLYDLGLNLQILFTVLLMVQTIGLIFFFSEKYNLSRIVKGIIVFLILTNGLFLQIAVIVGAFDIIFDFRRFKRS